MDRHKAIANTVLAQRHAGKNVLHANVSSCYSLPLLAGCPLSPNFNFSSKTSLLHTILHVIFHSHTGHLKNS